MTDMTVEQLVSKRTSLEKELRSWQQKAAIAKADAERIKNEITADLAKLKETFGCDTIEQAKELRSALLAQLDERCTELESQLNDLRNS
jgi:hypothetical protein